MKTQKIGTFICICHILCHLYTCTCFNYTYVYTYIHFNKHNSIKINCNCVSLYSKHTRTFLVNYIRLLIVKFELQSMFHHPIITSYLKQTASVIAFNYCKSFLTKQITEYTLHTIVTVTRLRPHWDKRALCFATQLVGHFCVCDVV